MHPRGCLRLLITEFEMYFKENERMIKGTCIKNESLDYSGNEMRKWELEIGKSYDIIVIINNSINFENHQSLVNFVDKNSYYTPSGYVPKELFQIDESSFSNYYHKYENEDGEIITEPRKWSKEMYEPKEFSFWEDYYNDEEKALNTYLNTLDKLGIKNVW